MYKKTIYGLAVMGALAGVAVSLLYVQATCEVEPTVTAAELEGRWNCTTEWTHQNSSGDSVPCSVKKEVLVSSNTQVTTSGVVSIGQAQWFETTTGRLSVDGATVCENQASLKTKAQNEPALQFEAQKLGGKSLSSVQSKEDYKRCAQINEITSNHIRTTNPEGRVTLCKRL